MKKVPGVDINGNETEFEIVIPEKKTFTDYDTVVEIIEWFLKEYTDSRLLVPETNAIMAVRGQIQALEIIVNKRVDMFQLLIAIKLNSLEEYNKKHAKYLKLTQEEFDCLAKLFK